MTVIAPPGANPGKYPTLGFDPAPGNVLAVDRTSQEISSVAGDLAGLRDALRKVAVVDGIWEGIAAQAFSRVAEPLPKQADEIAGALNQASGLVTGWEDSLDGYQRRAAELEAQAAGTKAELEQARADPALDLAGQYFPDEESLRRAQARYETAVQRLRTLDEEFDEVVERAKKLLETHQEEAKRVARLIDKIIEDTRGLLDRLGDAVGDAIDALGEFAGNVWDWVQEHAEFIKNIGDAFSALGTLIGAAAVVVGVAGLAFPPLEAVAGGLGIASAVCSGIALGAHGLAKAAGADVSWSTLGLDALGVVSLGVGKVVTRVGTSAARIAGLGFDSFGLGAGVGDAGGVDDVVEDLGKYWLPDSAAEGGLMAASPVGLAVWNAWEEAEGTNG